MQGFGDFANIDLEKLVGNMDQQLARLEAFQKGIGECVGYAQDEDGFVTIEFGNEGMRTLELHPKAMRLSSGELADLIKTVLGDAAADFQSRLAEVGDEVFGKGDNPMNAVKDPEAVLGRLKQAQALYDRAFEDTMGELDRIRRRMEL